MQFKDYILLILTNIITGMAVWIVKTLFEIAALTGA